jgi:hypothetical protein
MPQSILRGGRHTVAATLTKLADNDTGFRVLTFRLASGATTDIQWGVVDEDGNPEVCMFLQADESWTIGPNAGTVRPSDIYILGTAGDIVHWVGVIV